LKVLQVTTHVNIGGIANYILTLSETLSAKRVRVVVASSGGNLEDEFKLRGLPHIFLNIKTKFEFGPKVIMAIFALAKIIKDEGVDIVHAHTRVSQVAAFFACRMAKVPYVTTCHGYFKVRSRKLFDTWGAKVIAISDAVAAHLEDDLGVDRARIRTIYSGVDPDRFSNEYSEPEKAAVRKELGLRRGPVIGTIGRLSQIKGQRYLVQAMADVIDKRQDAQCLIVGDGEERGALENLARASGIRNSVFFISSNVDTARFLSIMDIFVFPSVKEGLGIALLEAMAAGVPCIASDIGGIRDIISAPSYGILVPVGNVKAMSDAIVKLAGDERLRQEIGQNSTVRVREKFSLDVMADKIIDLYKEVLNA